MVCPMGVARVTAARVWCVPHGRGSGAAAALCLLHAHPAPGPLFTAPPALAMRPWCAVWAWGGGVCDIPPKLNLPMPPDVKYGYRQHSAPGQMLFYVSVGGGLGGQCVYTGGVGQPWRIGMSAGRAEQGGWLALPPSLELSHDTSGALHPRAEWSYSLLGSQPASCAVGAAGGGAGAAHRDGARGQEEPGAPLAALRHGVQAGHRSVGLWVYCGVNTANR